MAQLLAAAPANPTTQHTLHDLGSAYLRKAREAALAKNATDEDRWLNEARGAGMKAADIIAFQRDSAAPARRRRRPTTSACSPPRTTACATAGSPIRPRTARRSI